MKENETDKTIGLQNLDLRDCTAILLSTNEQGEG
jgi:hypothetical protein